MCRLLKLIDADSLVVALDGTGRVGSAGHTGVFAWLLGTGVDADEVSGDLYLADVVGGQLVAPVGAGVAA